MGHRTRGSNDKAIMWYVLLFVTAINVKLVHFVSGALCLTLNSRVYCDFALERLFDEQDVSRHDCSA